MLSEIVQDEDALTQPKNNYQIELDSESNVVRLGWQVAERVTVWG